MKKLQLSIVLFCYILLSACSDNGASRVDALNTQDREPPTIWIRGEENVSIPYATEYEDMGAVAYDETDTEVELITTGEVDIFSPGEHVITYTATDNSGNTTSRSRKVQVGSELTTLEISSFGSTSFSTNNNTPIQCNETGDLCTVQVAKNQTISITAQSNSGWEFLNWDVCENANENTRTVLMDDDKIIAATATSTSPPVLHDNVIELSNDQISSIIDYENDSNILIFAAQADLSNFDISDILIANDETNNIVFLRRVTDIITLEGAPTIVETSPAALSDVIKSGSIIVELDESQDSSPQNTPQSGMSPHSVSTQSRKTSQAVLEITRSGSLTLTAKGSVSTDLNTEVNHTPSLALLFAGEGLQSVRFISEASITAKVNVEVRGQGQASASSQVDLPSYRFKRFILISGVPVYLEANIQPFLDAQVDGSFTSSLTPSVETSITGAVGAQWNRRAGWTSLSRFRNSGQTELGPHLEGELGLEVGAGMDVDLTVYRLLGPKLTARAYGGVRARSTPLDRNNCTYNITRYIGVAGNVGGSIDFLSYDLAAPSIPFNRKKVLSNTAQNCDLEPPRGPNNVTVTVTGSSTLHLIWPEAEDDTGIDFYEVWRRHGNWGRTHRVATTSTLNFHDRNLDASSEYCYFIVAVDSVGKTSNRNAQSNTIECATTNEATPLPPFTPRLTDFIPLSTTSMKLRFQANHQINPANPVHYIVYINSGSSPREFTYAKVSENRNDLNLFGLKPDTEYCVRMRAVDSLGQYSDPTVTLCNRTLPRILSRWRMDLACQGQDFNITQRLDLDETLTSRVRVTGRGNDYDGTPLSYVIRGNYNSDNSTLSAQIDWQFQNSNSTRRDLFTTNLSGGNTGIVPMRQVSGNGCDGVIRFTRTGSSPQTTSIPQTSLDTASTSLSQGQIGTFREQ